MGKILSDIIAIPWNHPESAASTWTCEEIDIPSAAREGIGCIIIGADIMGQEHTDVPAAGATAEQFMQMVLEEYKASQPAAGNADVIALLQRLYYRGGGEAGYSVIHEMRLGLTGKMVPPEYGYKTARQKIYIGHVSTSAGTAMYTSGRIYLVMVQFTQEEMAELGMREAYDE